MEKEITWNPSFPQVLLDDQQLSRNDLEIPQRLPVIKVIHFTQI
jgi:hypothetical protein